MNFIHLNSKFIFDSLNLQQQQQKKNILFKTVERKNITTTLPLNPDAVI